MPIETINYKGWPNSCRLSNNLVDLVVTADVGPRIIRFGFLGEQNELKEFPAMLGKTGSDEWRIYGGHRLWHAPEAKPRSYFPDNFPVKVEQRAGFVRFIPPLETTNGIQKEIDVHLDPDTAHVTVTHHLRNASPWDLTFAPWALTVMDAGGTAIIPIPPRGSHLTNLLPTSTMTLWAYTDMSDPRWSWGQRLVLLRQDPQRPNPQKLGLGVPDGWVAYAHNEHLFVKKVVYQPGADYPDYGCNVEVFTDADMLEAETLGPRLTLTPNEAVEHIEDWYLLGGIPAPTDPAMVERDIFPRLAAL